MKKNYQSFARQPENIFAEVKLRLPFLHHANQPAIPDGKEGVWLQGLGFSDQKF